MQSKEYFSEKVADTITAMLAYWDKDQICRFANNAYLEWFGKRSEDMIDKMTLKELLGPLYQKNLIYIEEAYKGNVQVFEREIPTPDGSVRQSMATYTPDIVNGEVQGIIVHVADVSYLKNIELQLKFAKEKAEELATHDFLTGLPNRVLLNDRIENSISIAARKGQKIALSIMDMDDFKNINDTLGHLAGDDVLKEIANRSKSAIRECDTISRIGGDEFVILIIDIDNKEQAAVMVNRLLDSTKSPFKIQNTVLYPTYSLGIAIYPENGKTPEELFRNADRALYKSKESGKNRVSFAE